MYFSLLLPHISLILPHIATYCTHIATYYYILPHIAYTVMQVLTLAETKVKHCSEQLVKETKLRDSVSAACQEVSTLSCDEVCYQPVAACTG